MTSSMPNVPATKDVAGQPLTQDDGPLSPWWIRAMVIVMVLGFSGLALITTLSYHNAPPIPERVVNAQGALVFSADDVSEGQAVFLRYSLMDNGSIWGHGASLGPDFSAAALHRMGRITAQAIAQEQYHQTIKALNPSQAAAAQAQTAVSLKANRYDATTGVLQLWDVLQSGYWHARSLEYIGSDRSRLIEWLRMPGNMVFIVFIVFGAIPLVIATVKAYVNLRTAPRGDGAALRL